MTAIGDRLRLSQVGTVTKDVGKVDWQQGR